MIQHRGEARPKTGRQSGHDDPAGGRDAGCRIGLCRELWVKLPPAPAGKR